MVWPEGREETGPHLSTCLVPEERRGLNRTGEHRDHDHQLTQMICWLSPHSGSVSWGLNPGLLHHIQHTWDLCLKTLSCAPDSCLNWSTSLGCDLRFCPFPNALSPGPEQGQGYRHWHLTFENDPHVCNSENQVESLKNWGGGIYDHLSDWGIPNMDSKWGFLFKGQTVLGSV